MNHRRFLICLSACLGSIALVFASLHAASAQSRQLEASARARLEEIQVENNSPTALGVPTLFTATIDAPGPFTVTWSFGDGGAGVGPVVSYTYSTAGVFTASVSAVGITQVLTSTSAVWVEAPVAGLQASNSGPMPVGEPVTFTAVLSQGTNAVFTWNFGDGSTGAGQSAVHAFEFPGQYSAVVTALNQVSVMTASTLVEVPRQTFLPLIVRRWPPLPSRPGLLPGANPDGDGAYTIAWTSSDTVTPTLFTLQEARDPDFSLGLRTVCATQDRSCDLAGMAAGLYFYRVRGENVWGKGLWSNVVSVVVAGSLYPNDPGYLSQWGLDRINAPGAWGLSSGEGIVMAVLDSGIDLDHPDLAAKLWLNLDEIPSNGLDDDQNGYVDDVNGWNFVLRNGLPMDDNGHGSHVAGIAAAATHNNTGISGLGWNTRVMAVKVLDGRGSGYVSDVVQGLYWAVDNGADIINLSLGSQSYIYALEEATNYAHRRNVLVVAAAGNCGDEGYLYNGCTFQNPVIYPAANSHVLGVGATSFTDGRAPFSESGFFVDVTAPGINIYSTMWDNRYFAASGTSMASPLAAGLAALVWSRNPALTNDQVASILMLTAADLGQPGRDDEFGYGRINAKAAVAAARVPLEWSHPEASPTAPARPPASQAAFRPGVLVVKFRPDAQASRGRAGLLAEHALQVVSELTEMGLVWVSVPVGTELETSIRLSADPAVLFAEPDYLISLIP